MQKIITLTLNPALDKSIEVPELVPEKKLRSLNVKVEPGGGGINVSRALHKLEGNSEAVYLSGGFTGKQFEKLLTEEGVASIALNISGDTRENFIVVDAKSHQQYRFGMEGPEVSESEWQQALDHISKQDNVSYIVASGSLPPGVPADFFGKLAIIAKQKNARLIADTSGEPLKYAVHEGLFMIKPNLDELATLNEKKELDHNEIISAARKIIANGGCEVMVVSMGKDGAILITDKENILVTPPAVKVNSTVGAGDSMVAGMVLALSKKWDWESVLRYGVAAGTSATMNHGTELCKKEDTDQMFEKMKSE